MTVPSRIRLSRARGFRLQEFSFELNGLPAAVVSRPSRYGNPFTLRVSERGGIDVVAPGDVVVENCRDETTAHRRCVEMFRLERHWDRFEEGLEPLIGHNLACWCRVGLACHVDVLIQETSILEKTVEDHVRCDVRPTPSPWRP